MIHQPIGRAESELVAAVPADQGEILPTIQVLDVLDSTPSYHPAMSSEAAERTLSIQTAERALSIQTTERTLSIQDRDESAVWGATNRCPVPPCLFATTGSFDTQNDDFWIWRVWNLKWLT